jgi:hypothetical protein
MSSTWQDEEDDDLEVLDNDQAVLPHLREDCPQFLFSMEGSHSLHCDGCYCFVCDNPVTSCVDWPAHCSACSSGPSAFKWKKLRKQHRAARIELPVYSEAAPLDDEPPLPITHSVNVVRFKSSYPRLSAHCTPRAAPAESASGCRCARLCLPILQMLTDVDCPMLILHDLNSNEAVKVSTCTY